MKSGETSVIPSFLNTYMKAWGAVCPYLYRYLHSRGRTFERQDHKLNGTMTPKACYQNCMEVVTNNPDRFVYCEGLFVDLDIGVPIPHAFILDLDTKKIIDPTIAADRTNVEYFGVPFKLSFVSEHSDYSGYYGIFETLYMLRDMDTDAVTRYLDEGMYR